MKKLKFRPVIFALVVIMIFSLCSCGKEDKQSTELQQEQTEETAQDEPKIENRTVSGLTGNFNPFTAENGDREVLNNISVTLGQAARKSETENEDGTVTYLYSIKKGMTMPQGDSLTAVDAIFALYVLSDPAYEEGEDGYIPIVGGDEYRAGMGQLWKIILENYSNGVTGETDLYTSQDAKDFENAFDAAGEKFVDEIVQYCVNKYADERTVAAVGVDADTVKNNDGYKVAFAMWCWQFASGLDEDGMFRTLGGWEYDLSLSPPKESEFWWLIKDTYGYNLTEQGIGYEQVPEGSSIESLIEETILEDYPSLCRLIATGETASEITGIHQIDDMSFTVTTTDFTDELDSIIISPMADYPEYEKGNILGILTAPVKRGAGEYKIEHVFKDSVRLVPNENYFGSSENSLDRIIYENK